MDRMSSRGFCQPGTLSVPAGLWVSERQLQEPGRPEGQVQVFPGG